MTERTTDRGERFWIGRLAMALALVAREGAIMRQELVSVRLALDDFMADACCSDELAGYLRSAMDVEPDEASLAPTGRPGEMLDAATGRLLYSAAWLGAH